MNKKSLIIEIIIGVMFLLMLSVSIVFILTSNFMKTLIKKERINFLLVGRDSIKGIHHGDTIMILSYNPKDDFLDVLSIPRDTINERLFKQRKLSEIFSVSIKRTNTLEEGFKDFYDKLLKVLEIKSDILQLHYFIFIDYEVFREIINAIGGIDIKIEEEMHYEDKWGNLYIHFRPGEYIFDGEKALQYVRYRGELGDTGRILRQQLFLRKILNKIKNGKSIVRLAVNFKKILKNIKTNFNFPELIYLNLIIKELNKENIRLINLPGRNYRGYWIPNKIFTAKILANLGKKLPIKLTQPGEIKLEVWNGTKKNGLAYKITKLLHSKGFDVILWGNYSINQKTTLVIDRTGNIQNAQLIADCISKGEVITRIDTKSIADVSVILGDDYTD